MKSDIFNKYNITKKNGDLIDEKAEYFVLRLDDKCRDKVHLDACRLAIIEYAHHVSYSHHLFELYKEIMDRYGWETITKNIMEDIVYDNGFVDRLNPVTDAFYPAEYVEKIKEASKEFFSNHTYYLNAKDITAIAIGCADENEKEYGRYPEYKKLQDAINEYCEKVLDF